MVYRSEPAYPGCPGKRPLNDCGCTSILGHIFKTGFLTSEQICRMKTKNSDVSNLCICGACGVGVMEPRIVVVNSSAVDISWFKPTSPNGLITAYQLYRSSDGDQQSLLLYSAPPHVYSMVDSSVEPRAQYRYLLEASNSAGCTAFTVQTTICS